MISLDLGSCLPDRRITPQCITTVGSEVCRVSVVDGEGEVLYNSFVKPKNKIVNYATVYSGITEELLEPVTTTLEDVQRKLAEIIDYNTVLVGHSLNCDLVVLKVWSAAIPPKPYANTCLLACTSVDRGYIGDISSYPWAALQSLLKMAVEQVATKGNTAASQSWRG